MHEAMKEKRVVSALEPDEPFHRGKKLRSNHLYHKIVASMEANMGKMVRRQGGSPGC